MPYIQINMPLIPRYIRKRLGAGWETDFSIHDLTEHQPAHLPFAKDKSEASIVLFGENARVENEIKNRITRLTQDINYQSLFNGIVSPPQFINTLQVQKPLIIIAHGVQLIYDEGLGENFIQNEKVWRSHHGQFPMLSCFNLRWLGPNFFKSINFLSNTDRELQMRVGPRFIMNTMASEHLIQGHYTKYNTIVPNHYLYCDAYAGTYIWVADFKTQLMPYLNQPPYARKELSSPLGSLFGRQEELTGGYADLLFLDQGATTLFDILSIFHMLKIDYNSVRVICCRGVLETYEGAGKPIGNEHDVPLPRKEPFAVPPSPSGFTLTLPSRPNRSLNARANSSIQQ